MENNKDIDKRIEELKLITREKDGKEKYAKAQFDLGYIYDNKKDFDEAEKYYTSVLEEDHTTSYFLAQFWLGVMYYFNKKNINTAEIYFLNVQGNGFHYAYAQYFLGFIYHFEKIDINKAQKYYLQVLKEDNGSIYNKAQYQLGNIYFFYFKELEEAQKYYYNVEYTNEHFKYYISAQAMLNLIINANNTLFEDESARDTIIVDKIREIRILALEIQKELLVSFDLYKDKEDKEPERRVAHYTKPAVLFSLLKGQDNIKPSNFRLNVVDFMNDPTEDQVLTKWLNIENNPNNEIKSFLSSFSFNHNSLNQFRLYGNEDAILGSSISIAFNQNFFCQDTERSINADGINRLNNSEILASVQVDHVDLKKNQIYPLPLFRCVYFDPSSEYIALAKRNKLSFYLEFRNEVDDKEDIDTKWKEYIDSLDEVNKIRSIREKLKEIRKFVEQLMQDEKLKALTNLHQLITLALMPISCLIKHAAFEDEDECRMIYITHISDEKIKAPQNYQEANSLYIEYSPVEEYIDNIYLGPKCKPHHKLWITNHIKRPEGNHKIKVIQSEMPLQ